jgi:hypothetical protein
MVSVMTPDTGSMPGKGTKRRTIRIEDELWDAALAAALANGESLPEAIRKFLKRYAKAK